MKQQMVSQSSTSSSHSFLLDDDSTLPFTSADILNQMDDKVGGGGARRERGVGRRRGASKLPASQACITSLRPMGCRTRRQQLHPAEMCRQPLSGTTPAGRLSPWYVCSHTASLHLLPPVPCRDHPQDLYVALPVPDVLKEADGSTGWGFLEKELRFSQM